MANEIRIIELLCIILIKPVVNIKALMDAVKGHGLFSTIWNEWKDISWFHLYKVIEE